MDLIYWRHPTVPGIKVEEITDADKDTSPYWLEAAKQVYSENGKDGFREIGHFSNGAPFLYGENSRISITHCPGLFAVATLPPTPDINLVIYDSKTALGIDAERKDRKQVLNIRERFLSERELNMIDAEDVLLNIQAWTIKEAAYKAFFKEGLDFREEISIERLGRLAPPTPVFNPKDYGITSQSPKNLPEQFFGEVKIKTNDFRTYSYLSDDFIITLAYTPDSLKFGKSD